MFCWVAEDDDSYRRFDDDLKFLDGEDRLGFIRKVYGIMATPLLITASVTLLPYLFPSVRIAMLQNPGVALASVIMGMVLACGLFCSESLARQVPTNYILTLLFTVCEAYSVAFTCAALDSQGLIIV